MYRTQAEFEALCAQMTAEMAEQSRAVPSTTCWVMKDMPGGHYTILGYGFDPETHVLTVKLLHGADSRLPGFGVFGVPADDLIRCDCGKWSEATEEQADASEREIATLRKERRRRVR